MEYRGKVSRLSTSVPVHLSLPGYANTMVSSGESGWRGRGEREFKQIKKTKMSMKWRRGQILVKKKRNLSCMSGFYYIMGQLSSFSFTSVSSSLFILLRSFSLNWVCTQLSLSSSFFFLTLSCHEEKPGRLSLEMDKLTVFFLSPAACGALQLRALPQHVHSHDTEGRLGCFRSSHCGIKTVLISSSNTQHYERTRVFWAM